MHGRYGTLPWADVLAPAIDAAAEGYVLDERIARYIDMAFAEFSDYAQSIYGRGGKPLEYIATAGYMETKTDDGKPFGRFFHISYVVPGKNPEKRPVMFVFSWAETTER